MSDWANRCLPGGWEWGQPWGLLALVLPLMVMLHSMRPAVPEARYTGAFALWRDVRSAGTGGRRRLRIPLARWCWILSLAFAALALAQPKPRGLVAPLRLTLVVDGSSSMDLPHPLGGTRRAAALEALFSWLDDRGPVALELLDGRGVQNRRALLTGRVDSGRALDWPALDRPGIVWITDRRPAHRPKSAGLSASGGDAVPGAIAARGEERWWWDGSGLAWRSAVGAPGRLHLRGRVPEVLRDLARAWAEERRWEVDEGQGDFDAPGPSLALIVPAGTPAAAQQRAGRDAWTALVRPLDGEPDLPSDAQTWLPGLVWTVPGEIHLHMSGLHQAERNPAAFVASWADLFDAQVSLPRDVVSLDERAAAGEALFVPPSLQDNLQQAPGSSEASDLAAWLGLAATVMGLVALGLSSLGRDL